MYIRCVEIKNYRVFRNFEITLSSLSLIIGENEAGKTSLFDALALPLNSNDISFNRKRLAVSDINRDAITDFYNAIIERKPNAEIKKLVPIVKIEIEFTDPQGPFQEKVLKNWVHGDITKDKYRIRYEFAPKDEDDFIKTTKEILINKENISETHWFSLPVEHYEYSITSPHNSKKVSYSDLQHIAINLINADRDDFSDSNTQKSNDILTKMLASSLTAPEKASINNAYTTFFDSVENTKTFEKIMKPTPEFENFFKHIDQNECIPNLPNLNSILSNITLQSGDSYLYQRGLGYRNLVYIFLLFEYFKGNGLQFNLCCIEEPEAHLSVNNLRVATDFIYKSSNKSNPKLQTLVSSHNPLIINKLQLSNVIVVSGDKSISLEDSDHKLTNYLRKRPNFDILKLLFSDRTILVEGTTEEMLINSILSNDEDKIHRIDVISIGQKGFKTFMDIWLQVNQGNKNKKLGVIRDRDDIIKDAKAKSDHEKYGTDHSNIIVRTTKEYTLENDLVAAGTNLKSLQKIFDRKDDNDQMAKYLIDRKAESMLAICDVIFSKDGDKKIVLPQHIQEVVGFLTND